MADVPSVQNVIAAAYAKYLARMDRPPAPLLSDYAAAVEDGALWVTGSPVTGVISLSHAGTSLLVENIAVHPAAQGTGLGRRLMEFAEQEAVRLKLGRLTLDGPACLAVARGDASLPEMIKKGQVHVDGDGPLAEALRGQ